MVKPSKSMQPEAVDLVEIKKKGTRGMGDDDFRNYMARKIDLQRQQFGLVLPPPPSQQIRQVRFSDDVQDYKRKPKVKDMTSLLKSLERRHGSSRKRKRSRFSRNASQDSSSRAQDESDGMAAATVAKMPQHTQELQQESSSDMALKNPAASALVRCQSGDRPDLFFRDVCVLVNGYTSPDTETIQRMLHRYGGDSEKYETTRVTHIIAQNLSAAKANMYKRQRNPRPVCSPDWIVDSVQVGRLLPFADYLIEEVQREGTSNIKHFFGNQSTKISMPKSAVGSRKNLARPSSTEIDGIDREHGYVSVATSEKPMSDEAEAGGPTDVNVRDTDTQDRETHSQSNSSELPNQVPAASEATAGDNEGVLLDLTAETVFSVKKSPGTSMEVRMLESNVVGGYRNNEAPVVSDEDHAIETTEYSRTLQNAALPSKHSVSKTGTILPNGQPRTVGNDPHFLESFFRQSRLSFIGSFKQRTRQSPTKQAPRKKSKSSKRYVFLVDMDSFFASVVLKKFPQYRGKPVVISHGSVETTNSTSECATCNYEARKYGIKKGMFLRQAHQLCPHVVVLHYDFEGYEQVSEQLADILFPLADMYDGIVEQVSCDEAYMQVFLSAEDDSISMDELALQIAEGIRKEVFDTTQCTATVGVASNKKLAKLAADHVKPNKSMVVDDHRALLESLKLRDLYGIGYQMDKKLAEEGLTYVRDVWELGDHAKNALIRILGPAKGKKTYLFVSKGEDDEPVEPKKRKTIGAECNYGVRFDGSYGVDCMIEGLAKEVQKRMKNVSVKGSRVTLKVKRRKEGAAPPPKFLGHGSCHNFSKSADTIGCGPTQEWETIARIALALLKELAVPTDEIRGMGIVVSKLDDGTTNEVQSEPSSRITSWFGECGKKQSAASSSEIALVETRNDLGIVPVGNIDSFKSRNKDQSAEKRLSYHEASCSDTLESTDGGYPPSQKTFQALLESSNQFEVETAHNEESVIERDMEASAADDISRPESPVLPIAHGHGEWHDDDIVLPPHSQIRMSQVEELPSPLRKNVLAKMKTASGRINDACTKADPTLKSPPALVRSKALISREEAEGHSMRQMSVKRMLKLAAVKSGQDSALTTRLGGSVSLTQLECLPLEMQLQLANGEDIGFHHRSRSSASSKGRRSPHRDSKSSAVASSKGRRSPHAYTRSSRNVTNDINTSHGTQADVLEEEELASWAGSVSQQPSFYHENIAPLQLFMDENPYASEVAKQQVREFLSIVISERRFPDAVKMLRSIKNRGDAWGNQGYQELLSDIDDHIRALLGRPLDLKGLNL